MMHVADCVCCIYRDPNLVTIVTTYLHHVFVLRLHPALYILSHCTCFYIEVRLPATLLQQNSGGSAHHV